MPILGVIDSAKSGRLWPANSYFQIGTTTVGAGGVGSVTFSSIPSDYTHLQIRSTMRTNQSGDAGTSILMNYNSDFNSNYANHVLRTYFGATSGLDSSADLPATYININAVPSSGQMSNLFAANIVDILDYKNTDKFKTNRVLNGYDINGGNTGYSYLQFSSGLWRSTSAITSITITAVGNFAQYSSFALYGIKVS